MIPRLALAIVLLALEPAWAAPAVTGLWLTQDGDGVIAIDHCGGAICAHIAGVILDQSNDQMPVDYRGASQCHLQLIGDAREIRPNLWKGHIIDPRNGKTYGVELHIDPRGNLAVRGFVGVPLLGETQTWTRYQVVPPADCRIVSKTLQRPSGSVQ